MDEIRVVELFAGVGGFRLGLENASKETFRTVWSNQWEPNSKAQEASFVYTRKFGLDGHCNENISTVPSNVIPKHDLLVGGFPCQDYSVAKTLNQASGIVGKKGVLWWEIHRIVRDKRPKMIFLENVDRLLKSPANQRGRDFAVMLASLSELGYIVEWRVINAADYGMPQRRRRVFIFGYHKSLSLNKEIRSTQPINWLTKTGLFASAFPVSSDSLGTLGFPLPTDLVEISEKFNITGKKTVFENTGIIIDNNVHTLKTMPSYHGDHISLGDIILTNGKVPLEYFITSESLEKWKYLKGPKNEKRKNKTNGFEYHYNEGGMVFPDPLDKPARTIVTGEGGSTPSRFKHVVNAPEGLRRLTPIELERLNMFPDDHTAGVSDSRRAFLMGNALVVGIVNKIGKTLILKLKEQK